MLVRFFILKSHAVILKFLTLVTKSIFFPLSSLEKNVSSYLHIAVVLASNNRVAFNISALNCRGVCPIELIDPYNGVGYTI